MNDRASGCRLGGGVLAVERTVDRRDEEPRPPEGAVILQSVEYSDGCGRKVEQLFAVVARPRIRELKLGAQFDSSVAGFGRRFARLNEYLLRPPEHSRCPECAAELAHQLQPVRVARRK